MPASWRPIFEQKSGASLASALHRMRDEGRRDLDRLAPILARGDPDSYVPALRALGCFDAQYRGSRWKTALAAALCWCHAESGTEALVLAATHEFGTDTDTIGTMAAAIHGARGGALPDWPIQDRDYIEREARRLARIPAGEKTESFPYPDRTGWTPPPHTDEAVTKRPRGFTVAGLGQATAESEDYSAGGRSWRWPRLGFGQSILAEQPPPRRKTKPGTGARR